MKTTDLHSLYLLHQPRLVSARYPILATLEQFSSASRAASDGYTKQHYWVTPLASVPTGVHTFGKWQFAVSEGDVSWVKGVEDGD